MLYFWQVFSKSIAEVYLKRREFIRTSAIAGAGLATLPHWWQACQTRGTMSASVENLEELFGVTKAQMQSLLSLALANGGDFADLFFEYRISTALRLEENIIKDLSRGIVMGLGIRVVKGDQIGYSITDDIDFEKMKAAARTASYIANAPGRVQLADIRQAPKVDLYPVDPLSIDEHLTAKIGLVEKVNLAAAQYDSKVTRVIALFGDEMKQIMYIDSEGRYACDTQPMVTLRASVVAEDGSKRQSAGSARAARTGLNYFTQTGNTPAEIGAEAARIAVGNLQAVPAPAGPQVVVLGAAESGVLVHEAVGHGLEADYARKGLSNYSDRVGQKVASEHCTIIDAGNLPGLRGSINVDDEGNLPGETILIENGILRGYLHDRISARSMGVRPTGNGRRQSYSYPPLPRMTNTYLQGGQSAPEEVIRSVKYGVYAKAFGGGQVDITKGDFTFGVYEAYLIENGRITAPLKDVTLIGNGPEVMRRITMVGNDMMISRGGWTCGKQGQSVPVSVGNPTVKVSEITVGGTQA